jgi:hypothetical protein
VGVMGIEDRSLCSPGDNCSVAIDLGKVISNRWQANRTNTLITSYLIRFFWENDEQRI